MRIALVHSYYSSTAPSGENIAVELQAEALENFGHQVSIFGVKTDDLSSERGYRLKTACSVALHLGKDPSSWIRSWRPEVVHVHNLFPNISQRWLSAWKAPLVTTIHNYRPLCAAGTLEREGRFCDDCPSAGTPLPALYHKCYHQSFLATVPMAVAYRPVRRNALLTRADRIVFLSRRAQEIYVNAGFNRQNDMTIIPNFVAPIPHSESSGDGPWLYVGRLSPEKGIIPLLQHWPAKKPLTIIGGGPQEEEVRHLARGNIVYQGSMSRERLLKLLPSFRGLVFPSLFSEGLPTVYLESLAAGLPVVAHAGNSAADDINEHATGLVFGDMSTVTDALHRVETKRSLYSARARTRHRERFSRESWLADINALYSDVAH